MANPLVSICCISYNHEKYIRDALEGFVMQKTNFPFEIVISDDCSKDNTHAIIEEYKSKYPDLLRDVSPEKNLGMLKNFVYVRNQAQGKYIALCEGDDYWIDIHKLQKQVDFLESHDSYDLCCTATRKYLQNKEEFIGRGGTILCEKYDTCIIGGNDVFTATSLIRTDALKKCYNDLASFLPKELMFDTAYWYWFAYHNKVKYFDEETTVYRILENSASHTKDEEIALQMDWRFLRLKLYFLLRHPLREEQDTVTYSIISEIEKYIKDARYISDIKVRQSKTYKLGRFLRKLIFWKA